MTQQTFQDKCFSLAQSQKTDIRSLLSRCNDLETAIEILNNRVKTLEDQNKQQFRRIGKLEGAVNTLTSLVRDIFQNTNQHDSMKPMKTADKQKTTPSVCVIPTSNKFAPLI